VSALKAARQINKAGISARMVARVFGIRPWELSLGCQLNVRFCVDTAVWLGESIQQSHVNNFKEELIMDDVSKSYWSAVLGLLTKILIVWFLVSFGAGILFADMLNTIKLGGYPLGFWFAHQGSMYIFIALIFYYAKKMGEIDRKFDVHED